MEANKALVRRWNDELINKGNVDIIDELAAEDYVGPDGRDRAAFKQYVLTFGAAFSDFGIDIEDLVAEGDKVAMRWTMHCTHTGEYVGIPATNKQVSPAGVTFYRIANGKIVEDWVINDALGMMQQLGAIPPMG